MRRLADDDPRAMSSDEAAAVAAHEWHVAELLVPLARLLDKVGDHQIGEVSDEEVRAASHALSEAYTALTAAGEVKGYSGTFELQGSVEAFGRWTCRMEEWFHQRDVLAQLIARRSGLPVPYPEEDGGKVQLGGRLVGRVGFCLDDA